MTGDRDHVGDADALNDEAVRRLLTRASELEGARATQLSVAELREIAGEAGIAPSAFEQALAEFRNRPLEAETEARSPATMTVSRFKVAVLGALIMLAVLGAAFVVGRLLLPLRL